MYPKPIENLIKEFTKLPGIGPKAAARFTFNLLRKPDYELELFGNAILKLRKETTVCENCFNISEDTLCEFCSNEKRDDTIICVIEEAINIPAIEDTKQFNGHYHVLGGIIQPGEGNGPDTLRIKELIKKIREKKINEIIIATNTNTEGETTALYLVKIIKPYNIKITRLGRGLSTGSDLEYADQMTIISALETRKEC
ncbi:MAG: recombination protein RecR [Candidatus Pacebacteria bacterium]|nr:recombination protein RecR [Candidatus Paceibacterota bacterium]